MTFYIFCQFKSCKKSIGFWYFEVLVFLRNPWTLKMSKSSDFIFRTVVFSCIFWFCFWDLTVFLKILILPSVSKMAFFGTPEHAFLTPKMSFSCRLLPHFWSFLATFWSVFEWLFYDFCLFCDCLLIFGPWGTLKNVVLPLFDDFSWFSAFLDFGFSSKLSKSDENLTFDFSMPVCRTLLARLSGFVSFWPFLTFLTLPMTKNGTFWHFWPPGPCFLTPPKCHFPADFWPFLTTFWLVFDRFLIDFFTIFTCFATVCWFLDPGGPSKMSFSPFWSFFMIFGTFGPDEFLSKL